VVYDQSHRRLGEALTALYHHGRLYGATRVAGRGFAARAGRLLIAPLAPAAQLARIAVAAVPAGRSLRLAMALPALAPLLLAWAAGELHGVARGEGRSRERWR
jgi:hypothetical protein